MKLIEIINLTKKYQTNTNEITAINNITFSINKGEILGIIGPSGCGKSTLLNIIAKLDKNYTGTIMYDENINVGYMMQENTLLEHKNNYFNALLGLKLLNNLNDESKLYVQDLLKKYKLDEFKLEYPSNLSGGMKQRLSLIRTLATKPNLLLLDEPFSKLDSNSKTLITDDIYNEIKNNNITTILITHDIGEAVALCNRIIVLSPRPAIIKDEIIIDLPDIEPSKRKLNNSFNNYYLKIKEILFNE